MVLKQEAHHAHRRSRGVAGHAPSVRQTRMKFAGASALEGSRTGCRHRVGRGFALPSTAVCEWTVGIVLRRCDHESVADRADSGRSLVRSDSGARTASAVAGGRAAGNQVIGPRRAGRPIAIGRRPNTSSGCGCGRSQGPPKILSGRVSKLRSATTEFAHPALPVKPCVSCHRGESGTQMRRHAEKNLPLRQVFLSTTHCRVGRNGCSLQAA
jgi:hypothetical protein